MLTYATGDATDPIGDGNKIIAHVCNNVGKWGAGFSGALSKRWPEPEAEFRRLEPGLHRTQIVCARWEEPRLWVCNMIAQRGVRSQGNPKPLAYGALESCLKQLRLQALKRFATVHMPRIGCGLAGGDWVKVEAMIVKELVEAGVGVTVYELEEK